MLRKTALALAASLTLGAAALLPTSASAGGFNVHIGVGPGIHSPYWGGYYPGYYPGIYGGIGPVQCFLTKKQVFKPGYGWFLKTVKVCH